MDMTIIRTLIFATFLPLSFCLFADDKSQNTTEVGKEANDSISEKNLDEVMVVGQTVERRGNKERVTITANMKKGVSNIMEMLGRMNGFQYNYTTQTISYLGSENVKILVDSIEKDLDYVRNLNPKRFDVVNIVYQPTGQYRGYDALISLHTKPLYVGVDGEIVEKGVFLPSKRNPDHVSEWYNKGQITFTNHKINMYADINYIQRHRNWSNVLRKEYPMNGIIEQDQPAPVDDPKFREQNKHFYTIAGLDYRPHPDHVVSATYNYQGYARDHTSHSDMIVTGKDYKEDVVFDTSEKLRNFAAHSMGLFYNGHHREWSFSANGNYYLTHSNLYSGFDRSDEINVDNDRHYNYNGLFLNGNLFYGPANGKWEASAGISYNYLRMDYRDLPTNVLLSRNERNIASVYINGGWTPYNNLSIWANINLTVNKNEANRERNNSTMPLFGAGVFYRPTDWLIIRGNYDSYGLFPEVDQLNPSGSFVTSMMWAEGNPLLKAGHINNLKLNFGLFNSLQIGAQYSWNNNNISKLFGFAEGMTPSGIDQPYVTLIPYNSISRNWRVYATYNKFFFKNLYVDAMMAYDHQYARFEEESNKGGRISANISVGYVDNTLNILLQYFLQPDLSIDPQYHTKGQTDYFTLFLYKSFLKGKLGIQALYRLPLHIASTRMESFTFSPNYKTTSWNRNILATDNMVSLTAVWRFSTGKVVPRIQRQLKSAGI